MLIAYVDESGDPGITGSGTYVLACVLIEADAWPDAFDKLIGFRRWVKRQFGVPVREEIKANYLIRNGGPFRRLKVSERARRDIYRQHLRLIAKLPARAFAVVIRKAELHAARPGDNPRDSHDQEDCTEGKASRHGWQRVRNGITEGASTPAD
jgi:hypothetical protein